MNLAPVKVKANAHYTCQECGSTELIQAHHEIRGDDNSLIVLCAECHSKKHPDVPKALFFSTDNQPYWHNKSASSLAKELGVHSRTVIRAAKRLEIIPGELSNRDENSIKSEIPKLNHRKVKKIPKPEECTKTCLRCGYSWKSRTLTPYPISYCPRCGDFVGRAIDPHPGSIRITRQVPLFTKRILERLKNDKATEKKITSVA